MQLSTAAGKRFTDALLSWHRTHNDRSLPWKGEKDPYRIWLSEIMLQQTRAAQGLPYYLAFTTSFPTIRHLADAEDELVFRMWQGLGYYNRCRNMLATARHIAYELGGVFPGTYEQILKLKGIGPYTAAAIASFAFGEPVAVVDGNVYRVLSRYFAIDTPIDSPAGKMEFTELANNLLRKDQSAEWNQAIMDLGATVCSPAKPGCSDCPLHRHCAAHKAGNETAYPIKGKKLKVKDRWFHFVFILSKNEIWISQRPEGDIWAGLHQPLMIEGNTADDDLSTLIAHHPLASILEQGTEYEFIGATRQRLTHQLIHSKFYKTTFPDPKILSSAGGKWVRIDELEKLAFPKTLVSFLKNNLYF